jgi:NADPH:quinone reductase-like Zn-dependent oxidoreductase
VRAITIDAHGGVDHLRFRDDIAVPDVQHSRDVRIRVVAAALNRLDLFVLGGIPGMKLSPGFVLGSDASGIVDSVGSDVQGLQVGDRVIVNPGIVDRGCACEYCRASDEPLCLTYGILGEHRPGTLAEYVVVPSENVRVIPDTISFEEGAAFPLATLTAWRMMLTRARVEAGEDVLIWGIGGGVALACLQIAKLLGANAWVTSSSNHKLEKARALGADHLLNHRELDIGREVRARTGKRGANVVIDSVGEKTWPQSLFALGKRGRLVTCGGTSGPMVQLDVRRMFWNQWTLMGSTMGNDTEFSAMTEHLREGRLRPPVDSVFPLEDARGAFERLASGEQFGKVVVRVGDEG